MPRSQKKNQEIRDNTRNRIIKESSLYFARNGFGDTKISDLAKFIGIAQGSIYVYFKSKEELYDEIMDKAVAVKAAFVDARTIDRVNIYQATINGMYESIFGLKQEPQAVLIDAVKLENLNVPSLSIIKGDAKSVSIAAASIIAKVNRDRLMDKYDKEYPEYGFAHHKGYGTAEHIAALRQYGPCPIHRHSFEPIRSMVDVTMQVPF
jgi:ribonuclease HII